MIKVRKQSYPRISLRDAVIRAGDLFVKKGLDPICRMEAAKLLGYAGLTGRSNTWIASLRAYGLIDRFKKGQIRVSRLAGEILEPKDNVEFCAALTQAAHNPQLFSELRELYPRGRLPGTAHLEYLLGQRGFSTKAAKLATKSFLDTFNYIEMATGPVSHSIIPHNATKETQRSMKENVYALPLQEGNVVLHLPEKLCHDSLEEIKAWTNLILVQMKRHVIDDDNAVPDMFSSLNGMEQMQMPFQADLQLPLMLSRLKKYTK